MKQKEDRKGFIEGNGFLRGVIEICSWVVQLWMRNLGETEVLVQNIGYIVSRGDNRREPKVNKIVSFSFLLCVSLSTMERSGWAVEIRYL